jgi:hypothetical protein
MTERSLLNVALKLIGLWLLLAGVYSLFWAFLSTLYPWQMSYWVRPEALNWISAALYTAAGLLLCGGSSWLTRLLYQLDGPLDENSPPDS